MHRSCLAVRVSCRTTSFFFFNRTATTEIYTLSLHDALPIFFVEQWLRLPRVCHSQLLPPLLPRGEARRHESPLEDRKSTRLNSSHTVTSYAVFCLKKKNSRFRSSKTVRT